MNIVNKAVISLALAHLSVYAAYDEVSTPSYPLSQDQKWYTTESYLYWKPFQGDLDYGVKSEFTQEFPDATTFSDYSIKPKKPIFQWSSGVRIAVGKYFPEHDGWDVSGIGTYYYSSSNQQVKANVEEDKFFNPLFFPDDLADLLDNGTLTFNRMSWKLNYLTFDLLVGRNYTIASYLDIRPFFGVRGGFIYQDLRNRGFGVAEISTTQTDSLTYNNHLTNDFLGAGPRVGSDFTYRATKRFSVIGSFAASLLWGQSIVKERLHAKETTNLAPDEVESLMYHLKDKDQVVRTNLEGYVGFGWEGWINNHTVRIAPSIVFEGAIWLLMNQIPQLFNFGSVQLLAPNATPDVQANRRAGHLGLIGGTVNLHIDF